ncbi:MAG: arylsulfatase [Bacteroidota bacterium]
MQNIRTLLAVTVANCLLTFLGKAQISHSEPNTGFQKSPNVILVMTDDQGIGDLSAHGNPWLKTPNLDAFYRESIRMTDFHVSPVCTPTRSAIMTGRYPINNGAWATYKGRDALSEGALTLADIFQQNGYRTGIFGKWHLGDNYPVRATDCGFEVAIHHKAGGVGELSDYWGNSYFDDVYFVNNEPRQFEGYCTDVWFEEAMRFIEESNDRPFFAYIPTNAPHSPFIVDERYAAPYQDLVGEKIVGAEFYGMLANFDENFGKLTQFLEAKGLADNTILIYMTDNGSGGGVSKDGKLGHNQGFRGSKGHKTEGGHRVPFFIRWPKGNIEGGIDIDDLTAHVDMLPTLASLCKLEIPEKLEWDGIDFSPLLLNKTGIISPRMVFVHHRQDWRPPMDVAQTAILTEKWRLVNGKELYDIEKDRHQDHDLSKKYPEVVEQLLKANEQFVASAKSRREYQEFPTHVIGNEAQKEIKLTIQHAIGEASGIWKAEQVAEGMKNINNTHALRVEKAGYYQISCRRWPKECPGPVLGTPSINPKGGMYDYLPISPEKVRIQIANQIIEKTIKAEDMSIDFRVYLEKGKTFLINDFIEGKEKYGVYYSYIEYLGKS